MRMEKRKCPQMWYNTKSNKKRCNNKLQTHIRRRRKKWIEGKMRLSSAFQAAQIIDPSSFHFYWPENSNTNNNKKLLCSISFQFEWNTNHEWWEREPSVYQTKPNHACYIRRGWAAVAAATIDKEWKENEWCKEYENQPSKNTFSVLYCVRS